MQDNEKLGSSDVRDGQLYKHLFEHLPNHRSKLIEDTLSVVSIASDLKISDKAIYAWFTREELPASKLKSMIALKGSTLTFENLSAFLK